VRRRGSSNNVYDFRRACRPWYTGDAAPRNRKLRARKPDWPLYLLAFLVFAGVFGAGMLYTQPQWLGARADSSRSAQTFNCTVSSVTDGDTFRCSDGTRIRLSGVAARERDGTCRAGHPCPNAPADAATSQLRALASGQVLTCRSVGVIYGRVAAFCRRQDGVDLSCAMVSSGTAARWNRYWGAHRC
jgi:endonuclease YncB( thermonuclease family)